MKDVTDHAHKMHKGPHHDMYIHPNNRMSGNKSEGAKVEVVTGGKGEHELGDKSHLDSLKGEPHGADVTGHNGKMHW